MLPLPLIDRCPIIRRSVGRECLSPEIFFLRFPCADNGHNQRQIRFINQRPCCLIRGKWFSSSWCVEDGVGEEGLLLYYAKTVCRHLLDGSINGTLRIFALLAKNVIFYANHPSIHRLSSALVHGWMDGWMGIPPDTVFMYA